MKCFGISLVFIIINETLHGCLEVWNLFACWQIFQHWKRNFLSQHSHVISSICCLCLWYFIRILDRGYYTVARRYEFYFPVAKQYFTNERSEWVKYCFCLEKIKFISSSRHVMFFLLYRQKDIDKIIEENYRNYVIDKLTCEIMENKRLASRM